MALRHNLDKLFKLNLMRIKSNKLITINSQNITNAFFSKAAG